jgi:glycosyltransferase involved in cell wall biosynthesis
MPSYVLDIELSCEITDTMVPLPYTSAFVLLRLHGRPVGKLWLPLRGGVVPAAHVRKAIAEDIWLNERITRLALLAHLEPAPPADALPSWTVIICTRDRPADLRRCLEALTSGAPAGGEVLVVDNAPTTDATARVAADFPVRYVREDRPGLNVARATGARAARGDILLYTDDDVVVDEGWVRAMLEPFSNPRVAAVTGLTMPLELESEAQELFEVYGGFGRGFERRSFDYTQIAPAASGLVGAGANMAVRRDLALSMGLFDAELDGGTVTQTGGDSYAFYLLLAEGYQIVYTPAALVRHRHRRDLATLRRTLAGYSVGGFAFLTRCFVQHGDWQALDVAYQWLRSDHWAQLKKALLRRPGRLPLRFVLPQIAAVPQGILAYFRSVPYERARLQQVRRPEMPIEVEAPL